MDGKPDITIIDAVMPWPAALAARELTFDEASTVAHWINERALSPEDACQVCGNTSVAVQPALFSVPLPEIEGAPGPWAYSHAITICNNCGFTRLFNATIIGLKPVPLNRDDSNG